MKKIIVTLALAALAFGATQALAATAHHATATKTLVVAMHDPGCHWFLIHGKYVRTASVTGSVRVVNQDEKTLKIVSRHGATKRIPVGKGLVLHRGHYVVMMVAQATDDNYLKLTVR